MPEIIEDMIKTIRFMMMTLAPTAVSIQRERNNPARKQQTEIKTAVSTTARKRLHSRIAVTAGKIIRLEISSAPIIIIPSTTVTAVRMAIRRL